MIVLEEKIFETLIDKFYQLQRRSFPLNYVIMTFLVISCHNFLDLKTTVILFILLFLLLLHIFSPTYLPSLSLSCRFEGVEISLSKNTKLVFQLPTDIKTL